MKTKNMYSIALVISAVLIGALIWYWSGSHAGDNERIVARFANTAGESVTVTFDNSEHAATLTGLGYEDLMLFQALSASGARYVNKQENVELWNKGDDVTISKNEEVIFTGSEVPEGEDLHNDLYVFAGPTWVWNRTELNDGSVIRPNKPGEYAVTFNSAEGRVYGDTDCNNFSGEYTTGAGNTLTFGPFMSTLMFCEGSQETEFSQMVADSTQYTFTPTGDLVLMIKFDSGSVIFTKK